MSYHIRLATEADAQRINEIDRVSLGYDSTLESTRQRLSAVLTREGDRVFVACRDTDGFLVGFLHAADYEVLHMDSMKNILSFAVDPAFQGCGLGRMLLNAAEDWAKAYGCAAVRLVSGEDRVQAHAFYKHCGYDIRKTQKNFIKYL
jgi:GNAT superfamily N-acetyltransferase